MALYTERHGMRKPIEKTYTISIKAYSLLYNCCTKYYDHLAWKYPNQCPDGNGCCGLSLSQFNDDLEFEIPTLFRKDGLISKPTSYTNVIGDIVYSEEFDQYALLDFIEFIAQNVRDISQRRYHSYFGHDDIYFDEKNNTIALDFINEINSVFNKVGLLYTLTTNLEIERIEETAILSEQTEINVDAISEPGLKDLLLVAIQKHKSPYPNNQKDAVEKIWDALERLKTYYTAMDKKDSVAKIVNDIANGQGEFTELFDAECKALTFIGNNFRIRHHETNKTDIIDIRHYDYFFNRCLSLIGLAIQYLE